MNLRTRIARLARVVADRPRPGQLDLIFCAPVGTDPDGRPVGVYMNAAGNCAEYVFLGDEPDPSSQRLLASSQLQLVHRIPRDDSCQPLIADAQTNLRQQTFRTHLFDDAAQLVATADGDEHAARPGAPGPPLAR